MLFGYKVKVYVGVSNFHHMKKKKKKQYKKHKFSINNNFLSSKKCAQLVFLSKLHIKYL